MIRDLTSASQSLLPESWRLWRHIPLAALSYGPRNSVDLRRIIPPGLGRQRIKLSWFGWGGGPVSRVGRGTVMLAWAYLAIVLLFLAMLRLAGDRWWVATLFTFGPRWLPLIPAPIVLVLAAMFHRRSLIVAGVALGVVLGPIMGFCLGWRAWLTDAGDLSKRKIRVMSYNAGGGRDADFIRLVEAEKPDIIVLAEWGYRPLPHELGGDWHFEKIAATSVASRFPIIHTEALQSERLEQWNRPAGRSELDTPWGPINVLSLHLETPREGLAEVRWSLWRGKAEMQRTTEIRHTESELSSQLTDSAPGPWIIAGDFNMPVDSTIYQTFWSRWRDTFSVAGFGYGYTKFARFWGVRIDHILAGNDWAVLSAWVGPDLGGDHRPIFADVQLRRP